jgi:SAM-dependent methyltransferase
MDTAPISRWSAPAVAFDAWFDRPWGRHASAVEHRMLLEAAGALEGRTVLDAGCGTGRLLPRLRDAGAVAVGVDADPDALQIAAERHRGAAAVADAQALPLADSCVDIAIASTVCEFVGDPATLIDELVRVTRAGGRVVIGLLNRSSPWGLSNRRRFHEPPWEAASFLDPEEIERPASVHGSCARRAGLYAPCHLPWIERWSAPVEWLGRRVAPGSGAFQVVTIQMPPPAEPSSPPRP